MWLVSKSTSRRCGHRSQKYSNDWLTHDSDPLAFQWLAKDSYQNQQIKFIDIDFPELVERKAQMILNTPRLRDLLKCIGTTKPDGAVRLQSKQYAAVGCDLGDTRNLDSILADEIENQNSLVLCTAEVSITYMDVEAADALIAWAAQFIEGQ